METNSDFDFLTDAPKPSEHEELSPEYMGPGLSTVTKMTPRKFANSVLEVYEKLGGTSWLFIQAAADPKAFLDLLKKLIPKSVQLDDLTGISVTLIDQFGNKMQIETGQQMGDAPMAAIPDSGNSPKESGQLQIATGGSQPPVLNSSAEQEAPSPNIDIKDMF